MPKFLIPGGDLAGTAEQVGRRVTGFAPGDQVYGFGHGGFAEYIAVSQGSLARKPANLTFEQAAAVALAAITAIQGLRAGGLQAGQHVLIIGASGGIGTFAVQIAKHLGAEVSGVCSTDNIDLVRRLGADHVIDYTSAGISNGSARLRHGLPARRDLFPGSHSQGAHPHGTLIQSYGDGIRWFGPLGNIIKAAVLSLFVRQTLKAFTAKETTETLDEITELIEAGQLTPIIDRTYQLSEAAQAVQLVEHGRPAGKVTITIPSDQ